METRIWTIKVYFYINIIFLLMIYFCLMYNIFFLGSVREIKPMYRKKLLYSQCMYQQVSLLTDNWQWFQFLTSLVLFMTWITNLFWATVVLQNVRVWHAHVDTPKDYKTVLSAFRLEKGETVTCTIFGLQNANP